MTCTPFKSDDGKVTGIACTRGRRHRTCQVPEQGKGKLCRSPATLQCDGCDVHMCAGCSVAVQHSGGLRDFCPQCFEPVFRAWLKSHPHSYGGQTASEARMNRRKNFRLHAALHPEAFAELKLSKAGAA